MTGGYTQPNKNDQTPTKLKLTENEIKQYSKFQHLESKEIELLSDFVFKISLQIYKACQNERP